MASNKNSNKTISDGLKNIQYVEVRQDYSIVIPVNERNRLGLEIGDLMEVKPESDGFKLTPKVIQTKNKNNKFISFLLKRMQEVEKELKDIKREQNNPLSNNLPNPNDNRPSNRPTQMHERQV